MTDSDRKLIDPLGVPVLIAFGGELVWINSKRSRSSGSAESTTTAA